jgi:hypothetical protein
MNESFLIKNSDAEVYATIDSTMASRIFSFLEPYFSITKLNSIPDGSWGIYTGFKELTPKDLTPIESNETFKKYVESAPDGPDTQLYISFANKRIVVEQTDDGWKEMCVMRVIRGLLRWQSFSKGILFFHGGLVELDGEGIAVLGNKRSGKTSLILSLLLKERVNYSTNDDVAFKLCSGSIYGIGSPRSLCIRNDTLNVLSASEPAFSSAMKAVKHPGNDYYSAVNNLKSISEGEYTYFYQKEITAICKKRITTMVVLKKIIFPSFLERDKNGSYIERLTYDKAYELLSNNFVSYPEKYTMFFKDYFQSPDGNYIESFIKSIAENVECYALNQSFNSLETGALQVIAV